MNITVPTDAAALSPIALFLQADWVVKAVMLGLLLARGLRRRARVTPAA